MELTTPLTKESPQRVLAVVSAFPPYFSGTGQVALNNAIQLTKGGFRVRVLTPMYDGPADGLVEGIPVIRRRLVLKLGLAGLFSRLKDLNFDALHIHAPFIGGSDQATQLAKRLAKPVVVTYQQDLLGTGARGAAFAFYTRLCLPRVLASAEAVIVPSLDYAQRSILFESLSARNRLVEIPNGVDTERFTPGPPMGRLAVPIKAEERSRTFLFVGALDRAHYFKGVEVLFRALKRIGATGASLIVVGDGDMRLYYESLAKKLGVESKIAFAGSVPRDMLPDFYRTTACTVLPSINRGEVFGITLLEAMACGRSTIATSLPGVRTVVDDGTTGLLVPPSDVDSLADAMLTIISSGRAEEMGLNGRQKAVARYDWAMIGLKLQHLFREVLSN